MNEKLIRLGLDSGLLNYVDNETPRNYFISGNADFEELKKFAESIIAECCNICNNNEYSTPNQCAWKIVEHFGV